MNIRNLIFLILLLAVAGFSSGCRNGIKLHKHRLSMFLVPMYKQPLGYSSTYARHLRQAEGVVEQIGFEQVGGKVDTNQVQSSQVQSQSHTSSEKVIFVEPDGKECKLPSATRTAQSDSPSKAR